MQAENTHDTHAARMRNITTPRVAVGVVRLVREKELEKQRRCEKMSKRGNTTPTTHTSNLAARRLRSAKMIASTTERTFVATCWVQPGRERWECRRERGVQKHSSIVIDQAASCRRCTSHAHTATTT